MWLGGLVLVVAWGDSAFKVDCKDIANSKS